VLTYRCYCVSGENRIVLGEYVEAPDLQAAIEAARELCKQHPGADTERIEVWLGTRRLYPAPHPSP
jgi:hypothetical protein